MCAASSTGSVCSPLTATLVSQSRAPDELEELLPITSAVAKTKRLPGEQGRQLVTRREEPAARNLAGRRAEPKEDGLTRSETPRRRLPEIDFIELSRDGVSREEVEPLSVGVGDTHARAQSTHREESIPRFS